MGDIMAFVASVEWFVLGVITFIQLRKLNKRMSRALDELEKECGNG